MTVLDDMCASVLSHNAALLSNEEDIMTCSTDDRMQTLVHNTAIYMTRLRISYYTGARLIAYPLLANYWFFQLHISRRT